MRRLPINLPGRNEDETLGAEVAGLRRLGGQPQVPFVRIGRELRGRGVGQVVDGDAADALEPDEGEGPAGEAEHAADGELALRT